VQISVVTITKNDRVGLQRTVDSVLSQRRPPCQWILVDGGWCSDTRDLALSLQQTDALAVAIHEADSGPYEAMAKGAGTAGGDYLCFLNGGDAFATPNTLRQVSVRLKQTRPDVLLGWGKLGHTIQAGWLTQLPAMRMASLGFCHQAAYYRTELLAAVPFRDACQTDNDTFQLAELIERGYHVEILPELLADRDPTPGLSAWGEQSTRSVLDTLCSFYALSPADAEAILAFRRRADAADRVCELLRAVPPPGDHPHTLCHLAILCLDTLTLKQATRLTTDEQDRLRRAALAVLHGQMGALATEELCQRLHQTVQRREQLCRAFTAP
jgi:hypothetical protein